MNQRTEKMKVVFCDDNDTNPFWGSSENPRAGFTDDDWGLEWKIYRSACPGDSNYSWTQRFCDAISMFSRDNPVYVVTDANFGGDSEGGSNLLRKLVDDKMLVRGVVFSTALSILPTLGKGPICEIKDDRIKTVAAKIRHFLLTGEMPVPDPETQIQSLSRAIHQLENLALPLRLDFETLEGRESETATVEAIWADYFGPPADGGGFLLLERSFSDGIHGL